MKKLLIIIFFQINIFSVYSTPERANRTRVIYIGHNNTCYYYDLHERIQNGSNYNLTETFSIVKQSLETDKLIKKTIIRSVSFAADPNKRVKGFKRTEHQLNPINPEKYLIDENVFCQFYNMDGYFLKENLIINRWGMFYRQNNKYAYLLPRKFFSKKTLRFEEEFNYHKPRLVNSLLDKNCFFFIIETGANKSDYDRYQTIFFVNERKISKALKRSRIAFK